MKAKSLAAYSTDQLMQMVVRLKRDLDIEWRTIQILIAAGIVTKEKVEEARAIVEGLPSKPE